MLWLRCGYRAQQGWLGFWEDYVRDAAAPQVHDVWPNKVNPEDARWRAQIPWGLTDDALERVRSELRSTWASGMTWDDLLVIERAPHDAERTGVDIAVFNLQLRRSLTWWPMTDIARSGDLALIDLAPHGLP